MKQEAEVDVHLVDIDLLCKRFNTNVHSGKSRASAEAGIAQYGLNKLTPPPTTPKWVKFFKHMFDGFSLLLWTGSILSFAMYILQVANIGDPPGDNLYLGIVLAGVVLVTGIFAYYQENKSARIMDSFNKMVPQHALCIREGDKITIKAEELTLGDIVEIKFGDRVPADIRILQSNGCKVDNSSLTGESEPQSRTPECTNVNPLETKNLAFFSTNTVEGTAVGMVVGIGDNTVMGRIAGLASGVQAGETPLSKEIVYLVQVITGLAVGIGILFFVTSFILA